MRLQAVDSRLERDREVLAALRRADRGAVDFGGERRIGDDDRGAVLGRLRGIVIRPHRPSCPEMLSRPALLIRILGVAPPEPGAKLPLGAQADALHQGGALLGRGERSMHQGHVARGIVAADLDGDAHGLPPFFLTTAGERSVRMLPGLVAMADISSGFWAAGFGLSGDGRAGKLGGYGRSNPYPSARTGRVPARRN